MFAGKPGQRKIVVGTFLGTNSVITVLEIERTFVLRPMVVTIS